jgi:hypothetical protein
VVHRDSQRSPEQVALYLHQVHRMIAEAAEGRPDTYFGQDLSREPRPWSPAELDEASDRDVALAAFSTREVAVNPVALGAAFRDRVASDPLIEIRTAHEVVSVEDVDRPVGVTRSAEGADRLAFDHVVNALWEGRLAINETLQFRPGRSWLHRLKYGMSFTYPETAN